MSFSICLCSKEGGDGGRDTLWCTCWVILCHMQVTILKIKGLLVHEVDECTRVPPKATGWLRTEEKTEVRW